MIILDQFGGPEDYFPDRSTLKGVLGAVSSFIGILLRLAVSYLIGSLASLPSSRTYQSIILGVFFGVVTTTIAGVYPANRAAKLDPIEALRAE